MVSDICCTLPLFVTKFEVNNHITLTFSFSLSHTHISIGLNIPYLLRSTHEWMNTHTCTNKQIQISLPIKNVLKFFFLVSNLKLRFVLDLLVFDWFSWKQVWLHCAFISVIAKSTVQFEINCHFGCFISINGQFVFLNHTNLLKAK